MSGIEVAGLLLGIIPLLIEGLETYKTGIKSIRTGFQRQKEVEKLCRILRRQECMLGELLRTILLQSGCDVVSECAPAKLRDILDDVETQVAVKDYLGSSNYGTLLDLLQDCDEVFQRLLYKVTKFVPTTKDSSSLSKIREINKSRKSDELDLMARLALVLNKKDFQEESRRLDALQDSLQRLLTLISENHQLAAGQPSRKAKRLARALWKIRRHAEDLYSAVSGGWVGNCHPRHEAKLFLEDRLEQSRQSGPKRYDLPIQVFHFVFAGGCAQANAFWHESVVQVFEDVDDTTADPQPATPKLRPSVVINVPPVQKIGNFQPIKDICSAIEVGRNNQEHIIFALTKDCKITADCDRNHGFSETQAKEAVHLRDLLSPTSQTPVNNFSMPWSVKTSLALNIASSFMQLLRTPWCASLLSTETVAILRASNQGPDASKPLLSISFEPTMTGQTAPNHNLELRESLIELGIMLLEIWHEKTLEERFSLDRSSLRPSGRRSYAFEWLESVSDTLPGLWHMAVFHCLAGAMNSTPIPKGWDDMKLWETMCESVIEPLVKVTKI